MLVSRGRWWTSMTDCEHTHYCEDCEVKMSVLYDERDGREVPLVCGHCGGTNTRQLEVGDD